MKKILAFLLLIIALNTTVFSYETDIPFEIIYSGVSDGQKNVSVTPTLIFEFNLRIDPYVRDVTINGSGELIEKVLVKEGKKLFIYLKRPLDYETDYIISLAGIKEIYESRRPEFSEIKFTTMHRVELLNEEVSKKTGTYKAEVKNFSSSGKLVYFMISAKDKQTKKLLGMKVISDTLESGETKPFSHTFTDIEGEYDIEVYAFSDFSALLPIIKP